MHSLLCSNLARKPVLTCCNANDHSRLNGSFLMIAPCLIARFHGGAANDSTPYAPPELQVQRRPGSDSLRIHVGALLAGSHITKQSATCGQASPLIACCSARGFMHVRHALRIRCTTTGCLLWSPCRCSLAACLQTIMSSLLASMHLQQLHAIHTDQSILNGTVCAQVGGKVGYAETGLLLDIALNRPDLDAVIAAGIQEASALEAAEFALYVGGAS